MALLLISDVSFDNQVQVMLLGVKVRNMKMDFNKRHLALGWAMTLMMKRGTELLPGLIFAKINFFIFRDMFKSLEYDVFTIIISNFD